MLPRVPIGQGPLGPRSALLNLPIPNTPHVSRKKIQKQQPKTKKERRNNVHNMPAITHRLPVIRTCVMHPEEAAAVSFPAFLYTEHIPITEERVSNSTEETKPTIEVLVFNFEES